MINLDLAEKAIQLCSPNAEHFDRAFLLLSYGGPEVERNRFPDGYPVLQLPLETPER
jgi:hypothetical protein